MSWTILFIVIQITVKFALSYENSYGPEYGEDWVFYTDDNGTMHYINMTITPNNDDRGIVIGEVYYYLYTKSNQDSREQMEVSENRTHVYSSYYDPSKVTKIITHGWMSSGTGSSVVDIKDAYMNVSDYNVIIVDWSEIADNPVYFWAAFRTKAVGRQVANMISALMVYYNTSGQNIHLIGHSLGAHVMGNAAADVEGISRVTGLDPARPLFERPPILSCLDRDDAEFVDIIHTSGGVLGYKHPHGHADFFPNGGTPVQPGCYGAQSMLDACSHKRAYQYYAQSIIEGECLESTRADSWTEYKQGNETGEKVLMGEYVNTDARGNYYLKTEWPNCNGDT